MTVGELVAILSGCDQSLPVATYANGHRYCSSGDSQSHGQCRVAIVGHYAGDNVTIGNISAIDPPNANWPIKEFVDRGWRP